MNANNTKHVAVIGAGPMGLMAAYRLLQQGFAVTLFEKDDRIGGMTASFDFAGTKIERFYHFICATDKALFDLLKELDLSDKLKWQDTKMGFYYDGQLYPWGDPISLLKFPKLDLISKIRYGLQAFLTSKVNNWDKLDKEYAHIWLKRWIGQKAYDVLWNSLFALKFYEYQNDLSASWIGTRIKRVGKSRRNIFQESLGYLEGGSDTLLNKMEQKILEMGGKIQLSADVQQIITKDNRVTGIQINGETIPCDAVVSTIPLPYVTKLAPDLSEDSLHKINNIVNIGVACVLVKLKQPFSPYFWMNINDKSIAIPGIIEYTNLNPAPEKIIYAPYYMPQTHAKYRWTDQQFVDEVTTYLKRINPEFNESWILATHVARYAYSQTVCTPDFLSKLPPMKSSISQFYMADTSYYYPEDRSITESVQVGEKLAELVVANI